MRPSGFAPRMFALAMGLSLVAGIRSRAEACGQCIEDKVAATYDYEVLTRAASRGHVVVFTEIRGPAAGAGPALRAFVKKALSTAPGVDPGTVRVSLDPPAASFACDPASHAPRTLIETINARISSRRLSVAAIEIDRGSHTIWKAAR